MAIRVLPELSQIGVETGQGWADRKLHKPDTGRDGGRERQRQKEDMVSN